MRLFRVKIRYIIWFLESFCSCFPDTIRIQRLFVEIFHVTKRLRQNWENVSFRQVAVLLTDVLNLHGVMQQSRRICRITPVTVFDSELRQTKQPADTAYM